MKKLYRSREKRKLAGIIGGLSEYFQIDATILRVIFLILLFGSGIAPFGLIYLVAIFVIPNQEDVIHE